jgi:hypothetical protein
MERDRSGGTCTMYEALQMTWNSAGEMRWGPWLGLDSRRQACVYKGLCVLDGRFFYRFKSPTPKEISDFQTLYQPLFLAFSWNMTDLVDTFDSDSASVLRKR